MVVAVFANGHFAAAAAEPQAPVGGTDEAGADFGGTAEAYAAEYGVSVAEANRRLELQMTVDSQIQAMRDLAPSRFAGAWIEHAPEFMAVVAYTGTDGLDAVESSASASGLPVVVRAGASFSLDELDVGLARLAVRLRSEFPDVGSDIDVKDGSIRLIGPRKLSPATLGELKAIAAVPVVSDVAPAPINTHTYGGRKLTWSGMLECTTGFTVKHVPSGDRGVLTAGHREDNGIVYHQGDGTTYPLTYKGQFNDASHDGQWMREGTHTIYDDFWDGDSLNDNGGEVSRANAMGDYVCHMGYGSNQPLGRSCGTVTGVNFAPPNLCGDSGSDPCNNVWIRVEGPNLACWIGDSGGPLFSGSSFYGITKACSTTGPAKGQTTWAAFMSRDFLADMNLAVLYLTG